MSRRDVFSVTALVVAVLSVVLHPSALVMATQGQALLAGLSNDATAETVVRQTDEFAATCEGPFNGSGLAACGRQGVFGEGITTGVYGRASGLGYVFGVAGFTQQGEGVGVYGRNAGAAGTGIKGEGGSGGTGVFGTHEGTTGIGVHGKTAGVGSAVFGEATGNGVGINSETATGIGVRAKSTSGIALEVIGRARFNRSGTATINGTAANPRSSVTVTISMLSSKSLILVTPQKNVAGVWVRAAVPNVSNGQFTIYLNKNVSQTFPVAWMVIDKP